MQNDNQTLQAHFTDLTARGRAVVDALADARVASTGFLLSCGLLPEVNEACTEGLHDRVHSLSERHFDRARILDELRGALAARGLADDDVEQVTHLVTSLLSADTTAAYLFGLAAGLGLSSLDRRLTE